MHLKCASLPRSKSRASDIYYSLDNNMELAGRGSGAVAGAMTGVGAGVGAEAGAGAGAGVGAGAGAGVGAGARGSVEDRQELDQGADSPNSQAASSFPSMASSRC